MKKTTVNIKKMFKDLKDSGHKGTKVSVAKEIDVTTTTIYNYGVLNIPVLKLMKLYEEQTGKSCKEIIK